MSRRRGESVSSGDSSSPAALFSVATSTVTPAYSHVSSYRSLQMQLQLYSPSIRVSADHTGPLAVFNDHDQVSGKVILDRSCHHTGKLFVSIIGGFLYTSSHVDGDIIPGSPNFHGRRTHTFFSSSTVFSVSSGAESTASSPRSAFREAFVRRRPSVSSLNLNSSAVERSFPFSFELPRSCRPGEEIPASHGSTSELGVSSSAIDISYKIKVLWEPSNILDQQSILEVPLLLCPDQDFQSVDASPQSTQSWLEMPLRSDRPIPFRCAVTLPTSVTFSRSSSIPYFVVFTTTPRSYDLAKEIAADATISVSLLRQIVITDQPTPLPTPPQTPSSSSEELDISRSRLLKRVARAPSRSIRHGKSLQDLTETRQKPLPRLPTLTHTESTTIKSSICIGFPKRPRHQFSDTGGHPSLESQNALPDGLHKDKIVLSKDMLPSIDWAGLSVKYYFDVSVLVGQDEQRARIPIRVV